MQPTLGFQRVLQRAVFHVQSSGKKEVGVANVLVAIFSEKQSHAVYLLNRQHVDAARRRQLHLARPVEDRRGEDHDKEERRRRDGEREAEGGGSALEKYTTQPERAGAGRARSIR